MNKQRKQRSRARMVTSGNGARTTRKRTRRIEPQLGAEDIKRLVRAPGDYKDIARRFADALDATRFRAPVSPAKLRSMVVRGERLAQRAGALQIKATTAARRRMVQDSQAWKSILSAWRLVSAAMPDRPELEEPFAFMHDYMSARHGTAPARPAPVPTPPA